jgi:hypothetical protein
MLPFGSVALVIRPRLSTSCVVTRWRPPPVGVSQPAGRLCAGKSAVREVSTSTMLFTTAPVWVSYSVYLKNPSPSRDQISRPTASNT